MTLQLDTLTAICACATTALLGAIALIRVPATDIPRLFDRILRALGRR